MGGSQELLCVDFEPLFSLVLRDGFLLSILTLYEDQRTLLEIGS